MFFNSRFKINSPSGQDLEPHQVFLDEMSQKSKSYDNRHKIETPFQEKKIIFLVIISILILSFLFIRSGYLQIVKGGNFREQANKNAVALQSVKMKRGVIYDQSEKQLVWNNPNYKIVLNKKDFNQLSDDKKNTIKKEISEIISLSKKELNKKIETDKQEVILNKNRLSYSTIVSLETKIKDWPAVHLTKDSYRFYENGKAYSHIIGYASRNNLEGKAGLEKKYNDVLMPKGGEQKILYNASGEEVGREQISRSQPGQSLITHLDKDFQEKIYQLLTKRAEELGVREANVIALDPRDGGVISMVSIPSYNNNLFSQALSVEKVEKLKADPNFSLYNQAISGLGYSTGSVIKPLVALAALEEKIIKASRVIFCPEKICLTNKYTQEETCYRDWKFHGEADIRRAIAESINTFFYAIGGGYKNIEGLGAEKIISWLKKFNWGLKTGIDLPNEGSGFLPDVKENWYSGNTYHLSIGQGPFAITPLQVATAFIGIANQGIIYQPQVVDKIISEDREGGDIIKDINPEILNSGFASLKNLEVVREGMRQAVSSPHGSAYNLESLPVEAAAKTGTAQTEIKNHYHSWIVAFAPYENPEIVLVVMLKKVPEKLVATKYIAEDLLRWYFSSRYDKMKKD